MEITWTVVEGNWKTIDSNSLSIISKSIGSSKEFGIIKRETLLLMYHLIMLNTLLRWFTILNYVGYTSTPMSWVLSFQTSGGWKTPFSLIFSLLNMPSSFSISLVSSPVKSFLSPATPTSLTPETLKNRLDQSWCHTRLSYC